MLKIGNIETWDLSWFLPLFQVAKVLKMGGKGLRPLFEEAVAVEIEEEGGDALKVLFLIETDADKLFVQRIALTKHTECTE